MTTSHSKTIAVPQAGLAKTIDGLVAEYPSLRDKYGKFYKACLRNTTQSKRPDGTTIVFCHIPVKWYRWLKNEVELPI